MPGVRRAVGRKGHATILVVEDNDELRQLACHMLDVKGYRTVAARDGEEALAIFEADPSGIDLLLSDLVMPRMSGRELFNHLTARRPDLPALYMSGYAENEVRDRGAPLDGVLSQQAHFIQKPFASRALAHAVRKALGIADE
jgi:two-component system cell cycle sensor histidine kinase/response regulator CckA